MHFNTYSVSHLTGWTSFPKPFYSTCSSSWESRQIWSRDFFFSLAGTKIGLVEMQVLVPFFKKSWKSFCGHKMLKYVTGKLCDKRILWCHACFFLKHDHVTVYIHNNTKKSRRSTELSICDWQFSEINEYNFKKCIFCFTI